MIPYLPYQRKPFFDFCLEKFSKSHTEAVLSGQNGPESGLQTEKWDENALYRPCGRALPRPGGRPACRCAGGHGQTRRRDRDAGGDRAGRAGAAPRAVCDAGSAPRQPARRAGRKRHRTGSSRAAGPAPGGRAGAGAGGGEPPGHRRRPRPPHGAEDLRHHGAAQRSGAGHPARGGGGAGGIGLHRAELAAAGGGAGASGPPCGPALRGQPVLL